MKPDDPWLVEPVPGSSTVRLTFRCTDGDIEIYISADSASSLALAVSAASMDVSRNVEITRH
jgi:hypothetical protein